jgi:hypothetical protein
LDRPCCTSGGACGCSLFGINGSGCR